MCSNILVSTFFRRTLQTWRPMPWPRTSEEPTTTTKCKQTRTTTECKQTMTRKLRKLPNISFTIFNNFKCYEDNNDIRNVCSDSKTLLVTRSCNAKGGLPQAAISRAGLSVWQWSTRLPFLVAKKIQIKALDFEILTHWKSGIILLLLSQQQQQQQQNNNNNKSVARFTSRTAWK